MKKDALLDAAEALLSEQGTQALTLTAVAARTGVSKGGLLYHFPTKEALIKGLVTRVIEEFDALVAGYDDGTPGSRARAFVEATFEILTGEARTYRRWSAVTAAATDPEVAAPLSEAIARWHASPPEDDPDPAATLVVLLAAEGLWEVVSHAPGLYDAAQLDALKQRLLTLAQR